MNILDRSHEAYRDLILIRNLLTSQSLGTLTDPLTAEDRRQMSATLENVLDVMEGLRVQVTREWSGKYNGGCDCYDD